MKFREQSITLSQLSSHVYVCLKTTLPRFHPPRKTLLEYNQPSKIPAKECSLTNLLPINSNIFCTLSINCYHKFINNLHTNTQSINLHACVSVSICVFRSMLPPTLKVLASRWHCMLHIMPSIGVSSSHGYIYTVNKTTITSQ